MEEKQSDEEPPDPHDKKSKLRDLLFKANGHSDNVFAFPFEEANEGRLRYIKSIRTGKVYREVGNGSYSYECIDCGTRTQHVIVSRDITPNNYDKQKQIWCQPVYYCPKCESTPQIKELSPIPESEFPHKKPKNS